MIHAVKHHPALELLEQYIEASLAPELSLAIAAHLDLCPHCQRIKMDLEAEAGAHLAALPQAQSAETDWQQMLDFITDQPEVAAQLTQRQPFAVQIQNSEILLPASLKPLLKNKLKWLNLGGISSAKLAGEDQHNVSLLYIRKDSEVPQHTHLGLEITLVLKGKIYDESGCYGEGDLLINTPDHTHTPRTMSEDCLCLSVLTAPLKFKKGLTRLLNPLQHLFY
ncbi:anti-sigma factor, putative, ChrR family [Rheinheimera sp. A13L]|uniref:ChrR family anti-sigma-E factor n=1 Tax=Rheinheimera sp. A13L TaxID=506534 RepID=UPI0002124E66|nr:ChrR family anti-sigma-E factor [Rheinheimera sp. A13L]EGM78849.1 anti-sigma factor, putative, ChrR family [Rheinheimera sp. A13L]